MPVNTTPLIIPGVIGPDAAFLYADFGFLNESGTAIELEYFRGVPGEEGVTLTWKTALEVGTAGYRLHRGGVSGEPQRIGPEIIVARGAERGADYAYLDAHVLPDTRYRYWLEELETSGESTWYGPVDVRTLSPDIPEKDRLANAVITESGLTRIGFGALIEAGISAHRLETARLQVLIDGHPVTHIITTDDSLMGADDGIIFYTQSTDIGKPVLLRLTDETLPEMEWRYVRPQAGAGNVAMLHAPSDAGALQFKVDPETARVIVTGFLESNTWLLDITEAQTPVMLYGYTVLPSSDGMDYSLYFSPKVDTGIDVLAVEDDRLIEIKPDEVE